MVTVDHLLLHFYKQAMDGFEGGMGLAFLPSLLSPNRETERKPLLSSLTVPLVTNNMMLSKFCLGLFLGPACLSTGLRTRHGKTWGNLQLLAANQF